MGQVLTANNAYGLLSVSVATTDTTISLQSGNGARFPLITTGSGNWFYVCLIDSSNNLEYCKVTATSGDSFTVTRGVDGSTAQNFAAGCRVELRWNAGAFNDLQTEISDVQTNLTNAVAALLAELNAAFSNIIVQWSGSLSNLPTGFVLCDGTNGTPNMLGKFAIGAGGSGSGTYAVGATGGASSVTLTTTQMPAHVHGVNDPSHNHSINQAAHVHGINDSGHVHGVNDPGHAHVPVQGSGWFWGTTGNIDSISFGGSGSTIVGNTQTSVSGTNISIALAGTGISVAAAGISISNNASGTGISIQSNGSGAAFSILPPYYALAYIMRTGTFT